MKYTKLLIGFGLALVVFMGVFYSHQSRYNLFSSLVNPVDFAEFSGIVSLAESDSEKVLKYKNGEMLVLYPGSEAEITKEKKEVKSGAGFFSGSLISVDILEEFLPKNIFLRDKALASAGGFASASGGSALTVGSPEWIEQMLSAESGQSVDGLGLLNNFNQGPTDTTASRVKRNHDFVPARVIVGNLEVQYPYSAVYIDRPVGENKTIIYALGGGVKIYYPGAAQPFLLPSHHRVTIFDIMISEKTAQLYYTKLQKSFRLEPFDIILPNLEEEVREQEAPMSLMAAAWKMQEQWREEMKNYAFSAHSTLISSTRETAIQPAINLVYKAQRKVAIGYPEEKKDLEYYEETLEPLVKFINKLNYEGRGGELEVPSSLASLYSTLKSEKWIRLMADHKDLQEEWNAFHVSHQAAIRKVDSNDKFYIFFNYWNDLSQVNTFDKIQKLFLEAQLLDLIGKKYEAKVHYDRIAQTLRTKTIPESAKEDVTNLRRGFGKVLRSSSFYQTIDLFNVFQTLASAEVNFYKNNNEINQEIRLEVARDALAFLDNFVEKGSNVEESNLLVEVYKSMGVKQIQEQLNRNIFSDKEVEMITFIDLLGTSRITREEIDRIKETLAIQEELRQIDEELGGFEEEVPVVVEDRNLIKNSDDLKSFFSEQELDTYKIIITKVSEDELSFKNLFYGKYSLTGIFNINRQQFERVRTDILSQENIRRTLFSSFLKEIDYIEEKAAQEDARNDENDSKDNEISQNDRISLSYRQRVLNLLRRYGIQVNLSDVLVTKEDLSEFSVKDATLRLEDKTEQKMSFIFKLSTETLTGLIVGGNEEETLNESIKIKDLQEFLRLQKEKKQQEQEKQKR